MQAQAQDQKSFEVHYSILQENGTLARKIHVLRGKDPEDVKDTLSKALEAEKTDMRKVNVYKVNEIKPGELNGKEIKNIIRDDSVPKEKKDTPKKQPSAGPPAEQPAERPENPANRKTSFICDVKQSVITDKDGVRTLKLVLEVSGSQVNGVQIGMLRYRPQESLEITCEPLQADLLLDDRFQKPEKQLTLDDTARTRKHEEIKTAAQKADTQKADAGKADAGKIILPKTALSQGVDSKETKYFFDRLTRQMFAVSKTGEVSKVDGPPEPLRQSEGGYRGQ